MRLTIPDNVMPKERKRLIIVRSIEYALLKFNGNKPHAARWLGMSVRTMNDHIRFNEELQQYTNTQELQFDPLTRFIRDAAHSYPKYEKVMELVKDTKAYRYAENQIERNKLIQTTDKILRELNLHPNLSKFNRPIPI